MKPTYSLREIKSLAPTLDSAEIEALHFIIKEEVELYAYKQAVQIYQILIEQVIRLGDINRKKYCIKSTVNNLKDNTGSYSFLYN